MLFSSTVLPLIKSRTLLWVTFYALLLSLYALLPVWKEYSSYKEFGDLPSDIHAALTLVLGWLLVFRTNTAYARWWEARTLWGALVNTSRNIMVKVVSIPGITEERAREFQRDITAFPYSLRNHLRDDSELNKLPGFTDTTEHPEHVPAYLSDLIQQRVWSLKVNQQIDGDDMRALDEQTSRLLDICGGCERIRRTRIAKSYRVFARQCVFLFLATFPWAIVNGFGYWTIPITGIIAYFMIGLETVAEHVEEPFGFDEDDLDLDGLCETIRQSVGEIAARGH